MPAFEGSWWRDMVGTIWHAGTDPDGYSAHRADHYEAGLKGRERDMQAYDHELKAHGWRGDPASDTAVTQRQNAEIVGAAGSTGGHMAAHRKD